MTAAEHASDLCDFELQVLRMLAGRGPALPWGATLGAALGFLKGSGLVQIKDMTYTITERGLQRLDAVEGLA